MKPRGAGLFISYRRPPPGQPAGLPQALAVRLQRAWRPLGPVCFDRFVVCNPLRFASCLVDRGLNTCQVLVAVVDETWLKPVNLARLEDVRHDWVRFELAYALAFRLGLVVVVPAHCVDTLRWAHLPAGWGAVLKDPVFQVVVGPRESAAAVARRVLGRARAAMAGSPRRRSRLHAADSHNLPRRVRTLDEWDAALPGPSGGLRPLLAALHHGRDAVVSAISGVAALALACGLQWMAAPLLGAWLAWLSCPHLRRLFLQAAGRPLAQAKRARRAARLDTLAQPDRTPHKIQRADTGSPPVDDAFDDLLSRTRAAEPGARDRLFSLAYDELRKLARSRLFHGGRNTYLDTTALVHECYLRILRSRELRAEDRRAFFAYASRTMRSVIIDAVRERQAERHGGDQQRMTLDTQVADEIPAGETQLLRVDEALQALAQAEPRLAQVVEMRYFGGYSEAEIAQALDLNERTVRRDWDKARLLLKQLLQG